MNVFKVEKKDIPEAAKKNILADIRHFLNSDCEYFWDSKTEMLLEQHPGGELYRMNFQLICERVKAIKFDLKQNEEL